MENILAILQKFETFQDVPPSQLAWMIDRADCLELDQGDLLAKPGDSINYMYIVLEGKIMIRLQQNGQRRIIGEVEEGGITGALPYSRVKNASGELSIIKPSKLLLLDRKYFREMIQQNHELTEKLVHIMTSRVRDFTKTQQFNEKMAALGKIAAGLAHELNNPAAAVVRNALELKKHLSTVPDKFKRVISIRMNDQQIDTVNNILFSKLERKGTKNLSLSERTTQEDEIVDWLEERDIELDDPYELAATFIEFGLGIPDLDKMCTHIPEKKDLPPVVGWLDNVLSTEKLVLEIEEASQRISELVKSVKNYTHMDRSPEKQRADIHEGIRNTITILKHKFKNNKVSLEQNFHEDLPQVMIYVNEMNQVWTNLIDNALDAMEKDGGILELKTWQEGDFVKIDVIDSGTGIPEDLADKIFDPFFTTKDIGKGTGMGLDLVHKIMQKHNGDIRVASQPGRTQFTVCLPIS